MTAIPHDYSSPSTDYPWQGAPGQSLRPFHPPGVFLGFVSWLSRFFPLRCLSLGFACLPGGGEFGIPSCLDRFGTAFEFVFRRNIAYRTMEPLVVVIGHKFRHHPLGIFERQRRFHPQTTALDRTMIAFQLAVALGVIRRGLDVRHATEPDEFLEVLRDKLRTVIRNNPRLGIGKLLLRPLQNDFHIPFRHLLTNLPMHDIAAKAIQDAA